MRGVVREEVVNGKKTASLTLRGAPNQTITISPATDSPGDVLVQAPFLSEFASPLIVCKGCSSDREFCVRALYDESLDWVAEDSRPAHVAGGRETVHAKIRAHIQVKRIDPDSIDLALARSLFSLGEPTTSSESIRITPSDRYT